MHLNVAIKVYAPGQGMEENGMQKFCDELTGVYDINHSNLLKPQHVDAWENMLYLIIAYLHEKGLMHQDIRIANVMIEEDGYYLITDFGVSSHVSSILKKSVAF